MASSIHRTAAATEGELEALGTRAKGSAQDTRSLGLFDIEQSSVAIATLRCSTAQARKGFAKFLLPHTSKCSQEHSETSGQLSKNEDPLGWS